MKAEAVEQAKEKLEYTREAVKALQKAKSIPQFKKAWNDFLSYSDGIYPKLEQGALNSHKSKVWYQKILHTQRKDKLLKYLHQARNSDLHGIELSFKPKIEAPVIAWAKDESEIDKSKGEWTLRLNVAGRKEPLLIKAKFNTTAKLVDVVDTRFNTVTPIPTHHLGKKIPDMSIPDLAAWALQFFETIVAEAEARIV